MYHYKSTLKTNAQKLRQTMTPEEMHLWLDFLKNLPITVKRQACIANYIVDFYIAKEKIDALEVLINAYRKDAESLLSDIKDATSEEEPLLSEIERVS